MLMATSTFISASLPKKERRTESLRNKLAFQRRERWPQLTRYLCFSSLPSLAEFLKDRTGERNTGLENPGLSGLFLRTLPSLSCGHLCLLTWTRSLSPSLSHPGPQLLSPLALTLELTSKVYTPSLFTYVFREILILIKYNKVNSKHPSSFHPKNQQNCSDKA